MTDVHAASASPGTGFEVESSILGGRIGSGRTLQVTCRHMYGIHKKNKTIFLFANCDEECRSVTCDYRSASEHMIESNAKIIASPLHSRPKVSFMLSSRELPCEV